MAPKKMLDHDFTSTDSETELIQPGLIAPPLSCVSTCDGSFEPKLYHWTDSFEVLRDLFRYKKLVGQNFSYDTCVFAAQFPELLPDIFAAYFDGRIVDTMYNDQLIHIAQGNLKGYKDHRGIWHEHRYNLSALSIRYGFGEMEKDEWRLRYGEFRPMPLVDWPQGAKDYALLDAKRTLQVFYKQLEFSEFLEDAAAQARAYFALRLASCRGMITDPRACQDFIDATERDIERAKRVLLDEGLMREETCKGQPKFVKNTKVAKERMERVCNEIGIPIPKTKKGKDAKADWTPGTCTDAESTRNTGDAVLMDYSFYTSADKARTLALTIQKGSAGVPLQTDWTLLTTGRVASSNPNLSNLPRAPGIRENFIPRTGFVFCNLDLEQAEAVAFAQLHYWMYGHSTLGDAINNNIDIHCLLASNLLGCPYEEVLANKKVGKYKRERQNAKYGNYGGFGGMGPPKFMATTNAKIEDKEDKIDLVTACRIINGLKTTWAPEFPRYFGDISNMLGHGQARIQQYVSGRIRGGLEYSEAANTFFQGLVADGIKAALLPITHEMYCVKSSPLFGSRLLLDLHDELMAELVEEKAHEAAFRMRDILLSTFNETYTPDCHIKGEPSLSRRWWKEAPTLFVNGQLVPAKPTVNGRDIIVAKKNDEVIWVPDLREAA